MTDFSSVTESWGLPATTEQVAMAYCRYKFAGDLAQGKSVLEVGCGSGFGMAYLGQRAAFAVGGDPTLRLLMEAHTHLPEALLVQLSAEQLPFQDAAFDVVLMLEMIYYVSDLNAALAEARRVLRPGGRLLICLPNRERSDFNPSPFSIHYPNLPELAQLLNRHGFHARFYGGFRVEPESSRDRLLAPIRHFAVRFHLIPRSMRMKALLKRLLYGRLPRLGAIQEGMASYPPLVELEAVGAGADRFKVVYAEGERASLPPARIDERQQTAPSSQSGSQR
jgi:ubiquinone/menaquinone biosynthesis C-methylase UbiE